MTSVTQPKATSEPFGGIEPSNCGSLNLRLSIRSIHHFIGLLKLSSKNHLAWGNGCPQMTRERAEVFGAAWNSGDADLVASFFAEDGVYHASVGPDALGKSYFGKEQIRRGVRLSSTAFPAANSKI